MANAFSTPSFELIKTKDIYVAASPISLKFKGTQIAFLSITNSLGSTLIKPKIKEGFLNFEFPKTFTTKSGLCTWNLIYNQKIYKKGTLTIIPNFRDGVKIASFLGPRSISAGGTDFSMFVVSPTDIYDNPVLDSTIISNTYQFGSSIEESAVKVKNGISWQNIFSPTKTGRILITASYLEHKSKEMTTIVYPALPEEFKIYYTRNHPYADGNQVISFSTDIIRDEFQNIISDGTLVTFSIINSKGMRLETMGTTINGKATGQLLHPDKAEKWMVTAYILGAAKSESINLEFKPAVKDFNITFSEDGRKIALENIQSFMGQYIPDGLIITLRLLDKNGIVITTKKTSTRLGEAKFELPLDFHPNGTYDLSIETAGIFKKQKLILK
ncbi:hypothetical protein ACFSQJ_11960 [Croceitalea marina]|uniref:Secretion system C-terminal sorting domain-containing protein n=1 Tax=Croceitalea marina TaxID=1775166 RepID=A0ABW5MXA8_9FLAO